MAALVYAYGKIVPLEKASVRIKDLGFLRAFGVVDVTLFRYGKPFLFDEHWARLESSVKELKMHMPLDKRSAQKIIQELISRSKLDVGVLRIMVTGGESVGGFLPEPGAEQIFIIVEPWAFLDKQLYEEGAKLITMEYVRWLPHVKILNYVAPIIEQDRRKEAQAVEILYTHQGNVLEASTSNFFIVQDGRLITAKENVLFGITRNLVIQLAQENGIEVEERVVSVDELKTCQEAFLTASGKDILPITQIDDVCIGSGKVGDMTKKLKKLSDVFSMRYYEDETNFSR